MLATSNTVTGLHFLLNLLSSFALPSFPFCHALHLCAWSPARGTPGPAGRSRCSDTTSLLWGTPTSSWVGDAPAAAQLQGCASRGRYSWSKASGWGTIPARGSSPGDAEGRASRKRQRSEEPLRTPRSKSGRCRDQRRAGCRACALPTVGECTPLS